LERIISMSGFDLRSFVPTVWELVPYSFIVDYFSNVGDCLMALGVDTSGVTGLWRTEITESTHESRVVPDIKRTVAFHTDINHKDIICTKTDGLSTNKYRTISRSVSSMPLLVPKLTGLDLPWKQFSNLGALILAKS
jgi:hypothetical protein